ncbi:7-alpha-hydroxycholest-4-en-3-one 12-alpha-hydroxylase-like [Echeneis naucrates]|uniref:7-alpha-hydroxycholest-4-en-3-one 12-alpha-hydroxylase-like n=1 Tax=Echeneis naucrates TaxID=173247 RepID=UPI0011138F4B|nr:7-alpha-hydroxycholest-4-en-3-one 12-alpha-hydroxylase [Echeneis naucrates]
MGLVLPLFLSFLAALIGWLYLIGVFRVRRPGEPPLDKGFIPWLGHVLEFRRNTLQFLERMRKKHGDVFTIQLGGFYVTFLQDPLSFGTFFKESREKLDFRKFAQHLVRRVFGYETIEDDHRILQMANNKHLMGDGLEVMTQAMMANLQNLMLHNNTDSCAKESAWTEDGLFMYSYNIVFRAGYLALYGNVPHNSERSADMAKEKDRDESEALFYEFRKYDQLFPDLAYGVLPPKKRVDARRLMEFFWESLSLQKLRTKDSVSGWIWDIQRGKEEMGLSEEMINRYPEALAAVKGEVDTVLRENGQKIQRGGPLINLTRTMLTQTPVLDSAVEETLRLTAAPLLTRAVLQDITLKMADGREYLIRKGDRMAMFPYSSVHIDPDIHPEPRSFKYDRFLNPDGSKKTTFYKAGKKVKYYTMPWGSGVSKCPGRFFATNELKQFIFLMVAYYDFELLNPNEEVPELNQTRWGFGTMHPTRDVRFRYRLRYLAD